MGLYLLNRVFAILIYKYTDDPQQQTEANKYEDVTNDAMKIAISQNKMMDGIKPPVQRRQLS